MANRFDQATGNDAYAKGAVCVAIFSVVIYAAYLYSAHPPYDAVGYLIGWDFVNTWMGARAALAGAVHSLFDFPVYLQMQHALFPTMQPHNWSYPPAVLLFIWPFGFLPYLLAYVLWSVLGLTLYIAVAGAGDLSWRKFVFLAVAPVVIVNLFAGQNGFFTGAILIGGLANLDRRPWLAGVCFGLLTMKPQLGVLIPLALILSGRWRCLLAAAASAAILIAVTSAVFGISVWPDYVNLVMPVQTKIMNYGGKMMVAMMPTAFMNARLLGLSHQAALWAQLPFTLLAIAAVVWTFLKRRDEEISRAILVTACFVATPYMFGYDMVVFGWILWRLRARFSELNDTRLALAVWALPLATILMGVCHVPGSGLVLPAFLLRLVWMLGHERAEETRPMPEAVPA